MLSRGLLTSAAAVLCAALPCWGQTSTITPLHIGDAAPEIDIAHWLKGDKLARFQPDRVYVLEFWATWCGPCRASIPHLSEVQAQFKDYGVRVIGVSDEELSTVFKFMCTAHPEDKTKTWNDKSEYTVTTDPDRSVHERYMYGVGASGIPTAFIVGKDGRVEWVGHPQVIDAPLRAVVQGEWDRAAFAKDFEPQAEKKRTELGKNLAARERMKPHEEALKSAIKANDVEAATKALDAMIALDRNPNGPALRKFKVLLCDFDDAEKAYAYGEEYTKANWDDGRLLNAVAWFVVDDQKVHNRDLDFALKVARRANETTGEEDAAILDTLARVYFEKGDLTNAVKIQRQAVERAQNDAMAQELKETLKKYEEAGGSVR
ncbi:MAG: redoxin domain-containing protein [Phycisphaerales bacterium]|nr:redoxin domain-containing protein [Phycisphaerales bacterium]MCI0629728.1 redoxin domain-containing protein [Phycisphaerales bacterium]MCI0676467.1 redoxin domain-containing protein [Phycisphaerales bacterium]